VALAAEADRGNGSIDNPYYIENRIIQGMLLISNTNASLVIQNCTIADGVECIQIEHCKNVNLTRNRIINAMNWGIHIRDSPAIIIEKNNVTDAGRYNDLSYYGGILVQESNGSIIEGNRVVRAGLYGIVIYDQCYSLIDSNIIIDAKPYGIAISSFKSRFNNVLNNRVNNSLCGFFAEQANQNQITNNFFFDCNTVWIDQLGWNYVEGNVANTLDEDGDGLNAYQEYLLGTSDHNVDSDGDNFLDPYEIKLSSDPMNATDFPMIDQSQYIVLLSMLKGNETLLLTLLQFADGNATRLQELLDKYSENVGVAPGGLDIGIAILVGALAVAGSICIVGLFSINKRRNLVER